jgi:hypothetical protein
VARPRCGRGRASRGPALHGRRSLPDQHCGPARGNEHGAVPRIWLRRSAVSGLARQLREPSRASRNVTYAMSASRAMSVAPTVKNGPSRPHPQDDQNEHRDAWQQRAHLEVAHEPERGTASSTRLRGLQTKREQAAVARSCSPLGHAELLPDDTPAKTAQRTSWSALRWAPLPCARGEGASAPLVGRAGPGCVRRHSPASQRRCRASRTKRTHSPQVVEWVHWLARR